ncbi:hypothetical protein HOO54_13610 [Bacillus sp. WMMC1349]|uniref:hypothetical protein n=1 Tax=Bacillus sp. WMMC1349 TaxID=2736254 RepID=UPI0015529996|nr:hypothetical protein [Bacillus sp. WMMC1349]NPC93241.1 hypothetical protein [Bacillus sp. WMMC1349]
MDSVKYSPAKICFANKISVEQKQQSHNHALSALGASGLRSISGKLNINDSKLIGKFRKQGATMKHMHMQRDGKNF